MNLQHLQTTLIATEIALDFVIAAAIAAILWIDGRRNEAARCVTGRPQARSEPGNNAFSRNR
jgi:hypothetical protein